MHRTIKRILAVGALGLVLSLAPQGVAGATRADGRAGGVLRADPPWVVRP